MAHVMELLTAKSKYAQSLLREERYALGGISLEELNRLFYAQVLSSHQLTWQVRLSFWLCAFHNNHADILICFPAK